MSRLTSPWPSPGESTPPLTLIRSTGGPDVPASRSKAVTSFRVERVERHDGDRLALAVESRRAQPSSS